MNTGDNIKYQAAFREFVDTSGWHAPHAVTLTMKQGRQIDGGRGQSFQTLTPDLASTNLRDFLNRLNRHVYGNSAQRHGKAVRVVPVIEGGADKRLHYHLILDCPRDDLKDGFSDLLATLWQKTPWGYKEVDVKANCDEGWTKYISKIRDKTHFSDSIDWANCHVLDRRD